MERYPVVVPISVHWGEMDAFGHVNNSRYFTWFETARIELFRRVGLATAGEPEQGPILARATCDFLRPVVWPAEVETGARIVKLGRTSFTMGYGSWLADEPDEPVARGEGIVVLYDYREGKSVVLPEALRKKLGALGAD